MSREWKPGDVLVDKRGRVVYAIEVTANSIAAAQTGQAWEEGACIIEADGNGWHADHFDDLRPVVVIDPEDREQVERLEAAVWEANGWNLLHHERRTQALQAALREFANPTPPKPEEPTGLGAVVEDASGHRWVRIAGSAVDSPPWRHRGHTARLWDNISAVRILSEGVQP